jgi:hypothetical protein
MNSAMINAIAAERNQEMRDHAAAIRLAREGRRRQRPPRARTRRWLRSASALAGTRASG